MNVGIITSYIIAGIILVSMLMMNNRVSNSSAELTLTQITREKVATITQMIYDDIPNMGYDLYNPTSQIIISADSSTIKFYRKIDRHTPGNPELITWQLTDAPVSVTKNPADKILLRKVEKDGVEEVTEIKLGVTRFQIWYFDEHGLSTLPEDGEFLSTPVSAALRDSIKQLYFAIELQSAEPIYTGGNARYIRSAWEKRFSPSNLDK
ncbi:MAG: hypothetical protein WD016_12260 [Balneolaceae bacterium]